MLRASVILTYTMSQTLRSTLVTITSFIFVITAVHAWSGPSVAPPNGNVDAPVTIGSVEQTKTGGLGIDGLLTSGVGGMIGTNIVADKVSLTSRMQIGNTNEACVPALAGGLRWTGTAFEGCDGVVWGPLGTVTNNEPPSYGGYEMRYGTGNGGWICDVANTTTGSCSCPVPSSAVVLSSTYGGDICGGGCGYWSYVYSCQ